ncbi:patatin-like phospholipase family protein [Ancylobacter sp. FA202]|uniref:patatin-like phospholipase family protein n=1 Tax=Ancylobacter sp. FA202 TaxID=1111106 RepID=UPI00036146BB|nr:patatin-like phospholipase family protein [Ancylobacter sp. FA202]
MAGVSAETKTASGAGDAAGAYVREPEDLFERERRFILDRRKQLAERVKSSGAVKGGSDDCAARANEIARVCEPAEMSEGLIGLALSGGGIRSAAFCLGVLQAMDAVEQACGPGQPEDTARGPEDLSPSVFDRIDYLSTVSGGGYIGASLCAGMSLNNGMFPFRSLLDQAETPMVQHIRDHSNYLFARRSDVLRGLAVYLRGLLLNLVVVLLMMGSAAQLLLWYRAGVAGLAGDHAQGVVRLALAAPLTAGVTALALLALLGWGVWRGLPMSVGQSEPTNYALFNYSCAALLVAWWMDASNALLGPLQQAELAGWDFTVILGVLAPLAGAVAAIGPRLTEAVHKIANDVRWSAALARGLGILALWVGAAIVPLLVWAGTLVLAVLALPPPQAMPPFVPLPSGWQSHEWVVAFLQASLLCAIALVVLQSVLPPCYRFRAGSLHRLYRDSLSRAFLVNPGAFTDRDPEAPPPYADRLGLCSGASGEVALDLRFAPYLLMNTAINLQASHYVNKRGRNADFFLFSHAYIGSRATGYVDTKDLLKRQPGLDVGTVIAASGAAFSSNMGANTIAPLTPTLTLLNARLGYWLVNPREVIAPPAPEAPPAAGRGRDIRQKAMQAGRQAISPLNFHFLREAIGYLHERQPEVYISDGGHIDNLGLIELLRRRCRLIIVIDAEADSSYQFGSFIALQRHARIDMGVRFDVPFEAIGRPLQAGKGATGPHVAVGRIVYAGRRDRQATTVSPVPAGELKPNEGVLVYVKSSLTGDESDIIRSYKRRREGFPHETTMDQLFSEEQFEVYRALGFHAMHRLLMDLDSVAAAPEDARAFEPDMSKLVHKGIGARHPLLAEVRQLLNLRVKGHSAPSQG